MINIRPATAQDSTTIKKMVRDEQLDPTSLNWRHFLVAEKSGRIVGIGQIREHPGCQELGSLVVLSEFRGQGIGARLISALEARAYRPLYLFCRNTRAEYYQRFGYQTISWGQAPTFLKLKYLVPMIFRVFGVRVILMRKD
jgi:amino-acid N-acetyltransferase